MYRAFKEVNHAFESLVDQFKRNTIKCSQQAMIVDHDEMEPRYAEVWLLDEPCVIALQHPTKRVVFNEVLNVNPFETALLGVSSCVGVDIDLSVCEFVEWKQSELHSMLPNLVDGLGSNEVTMNQVALTLGDSFTLTFLVRRNDYSRTRELDAFIYLNNSDIFLDLLGTKTCCISMFQEYLASLLGVYVGKLFFMTAAPMHLLQGMDLDNFHKYKTMHDPTYQRLKTIVPLVKSPDTFYLEGSLLCEHVGDNEWLLAAASELTEPFLSRVMIPMLMAYNLWRSDKKQDAFDTIKLIQSEDWRIVCKNWIVNNEQ